MAKIIIEAEDLGSVVKVEKLTPTQIVVTGGDRFRKRMVVKLVVEVFTVVI